jgi:hypothetical protein
MTPKLRREAKAHLAPLRPFRRSSASHPIPERQVLDIFFIAIAVGGFALFGLAIKGCENL